MVPPLGPAPSRHRLGGAPEPAPADRTLDASSVMVLLSGLAACALAGMGVLGCEGRYEHVDLLSLESVGPSMVEAGRRIVIDGSGLPSSGEATLVLDGMLHEPGGPTPVTLRIPAEIVSTERAEALVTGAFLERVGHHGRGTFRGRAELLVPMADGAGAVMGSRDDVVIDLLPSAMLDVEDEIDAPELGEDGLEALLGMTVAFDPAAPEEATVTSVDPEGRAHALAVRVGDVVETVEGMRLVRPRDLAGWAGRVTSMTVRRGERSLTLDGTRAAAPVGERTRALQLAALLVVLLVLLREKDRASVVLGEEGVTLQQRVASMGLPAVGLAALGLALAHQLVVHGGLDRLQMVLAPIFAVVVVAGSVVGDASRSGWAVVQAFGRALALLVVVSVAALSAGTAELADLEAAQTLWPTSWLLLASPVAPALLVLLTTVLSEAPHKDRSLAVHLVARIAEVLVVATVVLCLSGGRGDRGALGALLFACRGVLVLVTLRAIAAVRSRSSLRRWAAIVGTSLALAMGAAAAQLWTPVELDVLAALGRASAEVWLASLALAALLSLRPAPEPKLAAELAL